jgi:hypothetical protein
MLEAKGGLREALRSWVALPWTLVEQPAAVGWTWSKAYLLGLPLALWAAIREPWGRRVGLGILVYSLVFALLSFPDSRLLLPIAPLWCHLIGRGADRLLAVRARPRARLAAVAVAALLLLAPGSRKGWRDLAARRLPPHDRAGREAYLRAHLPAYPALEHLNRTRGAQASVYAFFAENLAYYAEGRYQGDWFGPAGYGTVFPVLGDADALAGRLRELGADHLLLSRHGPYPRPPLPDGDPAVARRFELVFADAGARLYRIREGGTPEVPSHQAGDPSIGPANVTSQRSGITSSM